METPEGLTPEVVLTDHAALAGLSADWPHLLGHNRVVADGRETLLRIGDDPLLVVDPRSACGAWFCSLRSWDCVSQRISR